jgi:cytochrome c biogenesis factor
MKKVFLISPIFAAVLFTIPESVELMAQEDGPYIPVVFELMLLVLGYIVGGIINAIIIIPACLMLRVKSSNLILGLILSLCIALIGTTIPYAYDLFGIRSSILDPAYLFPLFIPLTVTSFVSFFLLTRNPVLSKAAKVISENDQQDQDQN